MTDMIPATAFSSATTYYSQDEYEIYDPFVEPPFLDEKHGVTLKFMLNAIKRKQARDYAINRLFYDGEHWQNGDGWQGELPPATSPDAVRVRRMLARQFVSKNCIKEVTNRKVDGFIGLEPTWSFVPLRTVANGEAFSAQEQSLIAEAEACITAWWDDRKAHSALQDAFIDACLGGASVLRIFIPPGLINANGDIVLDEGSFTSLGAKVIERKQQLLDEAAAATIRSSADTTLPPNPVTGQTTKLDNDAATTPPKPQRAPAEIVADEQNMLRLAAALDHIYVQAVAPINATVVTDPNTMRQVGMYHIRDGRGITHGELSYLIGRGNAARTIVRVMRSTDKNGNPTTGGGKTKRLIMSRDGMIDTTTANGSESDRRGAAPQRTTQTILTENERPDPAETRQADRETVAEMVMELQGNMTMFEIEIPKLISEQVRTLQRAINQAYTMATSNIQLAGFLERTVLNGQLPGHFEPLENDPTKERFVRDEFMVGGGAVNFINGIPQYDKDKNFIGVTDPDIRYKDPVNPESFTKTILMHYMGLLQETQQVHYLLAGEQYASGESRKQARADFEDSLRKMKTIGQQCGRWLLETVLNMAAWILDEPERYTSLRCVFTARINPGPATTESIRSAIELWKSELKSRTGAMTMAGEEDSVAEARQIDTDAANGIVPPEKRNAQLAKETALLANQNNEDAATTREAKNGAKPQAANKQSDA